VATSDLQQLGHAHAGEEVGGRCDALDRGLSEVDDGAPWFLTDRQCEDPV